MYSNVHFCYNMRVLCTVVAVVKFLTLRQRIQIFILHTRDDYAFIVIMALCAILHAFWLDFHVILISQDFQFKLRFSIDCDLLADIEVEK